jgi:hypothetical protein
VPSGYHGGPRPVTLPAQRCSVADGLDSCDGCAGDHHLHRASRTSPWSPCVTTRRGSDPSVADLALAVEIMATGQLLDIVLLAHPNIGQARLLSL